VLESGDDVLSGLVALDDNTRLYVLIEKDEHGMFRPGHKQPVPVDINKSAKVEIPILKGSIVLWHGTLCHAGADYAQENIRLFFTNAKKHVDNFFCMVLKQKD
jgi:ectoine hydroxylase-related dioxygenase (phytanoyl-CoA dioxygenase family)